MSVEKRLSELPEVVALQRGFMLEMHDMGVDTIIVHVGQDDSVSMVASMDDLVRVLDALGAAAARAAEIREDKVLAAASAAVVAAQGVGGPDMAVMVLVGDGSKVTCSAAELDKDDVVQDLAEIAKSVDTIVNAPSSQRH